MSKIGIIPKIVLGLGKMGLKSSIPTLSKYARSEDLNLAIEAVNTLFHVQTPEAVNVLEDIVLDPNTDSSIRLEILHRLYSPFITPQVLKFKRLIENLPGLALEDESPHIRDYAIKLMEHLSTVSPHSIPFKTYVDAIIEVLNREKKNSDWIHINNPKESAIDFLFSLIRRKSLNSEYEHRCKEALKDTALHDADPYIRRQLLQRFASFTWEDDLKQWVREVVIGSVLNENDLDVRELAITGLKNIGTPNEIKLLRDIIADKNTPPQIRIVAAEVIEHIKGRYYGTEEWLKYAYEEEALEKIQDLINRKRFEELVDLVGLDACQIVVESSPGKARELINLGMIKADEGKIRLMEKALKRKKPGQQILKDLGIRA